MSACKILVIDDDEDDVEILANAFVQSGVEAIYHVQTAMQAFIYLQSLEKDCLPKLIITDNFLPGMSGKEFLTDLRKMEKYKDIHVVVLSTSKTEVEIEDYRKLGLLEYIIKPSSYDEYVQVAADIKAKVAL